MKLEAVHWTSKDILLQQIIDILAGSEWEIKAVNKELTEQFLLFTC